MDSEIYFGKVRMYDPFKGWGFIRRDKGKDVFFYYEDVIDGEELLVEGDVVNFKIEIAAKGPKAREIARECSAELI